ncbi:hypothetical protein [Planococcus lenghuensis]|uniref:Uncharacterized protein n=1 Tax=Planococcus lenghuensis TaxID=2213202 RepID=A0A1Q2L0J6_9BACL|nr:hypothetical protein [Planococcus lenghuensis]AQQ53968.1 hypothetical protein B0X71_13265 [Planococcus lenghuensis]
MAAAVINGKGNIPEMIKPPDQLLQSIVVESGKAGVEQQVNRFRIGSVHDRLETDAILTIFKVARILLSRQCRFQLIVVLEEGMTAEVSSWLQKEKDCQQLQQVVELGVTAEGGTHFQKLDVCLWMGKANKYPLSILKGMAEGVPWIAVGEAEAVELLFGKAGDKHGPAGMVVPANAADMIADYCEWFMKHPDIRKQFGGNGRRRAMELCGI